MKLGCALAALPLALALSFGAHGQAARGLESVRAIAAAGAADLALERIEREQPRSAADPAWAEWELLRLALLADRQRHAELLARFERHGGLVQNPRVRAPLLNAAATAAIKLGRGGEARALLLQNFASTVIDASEYRNARLAVIDSYLAQQQIDAAYLAMLRFRQDFSPLHANEAERFVVGLVEAGRNDEAAGWLSLLDAASPAAALLRLRAGLITPAAAAAQARALLAKGGSEPAWSLLAAAGRALGNPELELEVLEGRLNARVLAPASVQADSAAALWTAYTQFAERSANEARLLVGDDAGWAQAAERLHPRRPRVARSLHAALALNARTAGVRARAQSQLLASLRSADLSRTALRLFSDSRFALGDLDSQVRFELGSLAHELGEPAAAVRYWQGLPPMAGSSAQQWRARILAVQLQAGFVAEAIAAAPEALDSRTRLDPESLRWLEIAAADALELGHVQAARVVYEGLLPHVEDAMRMTLVAGLARAHEAGGDHRAAAEAWLAVATSAKDPQGDPAALRAREAAGASLLRAGLRDDARAVFEWLARNARTTEARQAAARRLSRL